MADTTVKTGKVRLSYFKAYEGELNDDGVMVYPTSILIPKGDKETIKKINAAVEAAIEEGKTKFWNGKIPKNLKTPLRDGDDERPEDEAYEGHFFLNAKSSKRKPGIAKPIGKNADGTVKFQEITDSTEIYSGCYARVSLNFFPFNAKGNAGVGVGLNNIVKVQDGEALGGVAPNLEAEFADDDFDIDDDENFLD